MSINLTKAAVQAFDAEVKHEYQGMKTLRDTVALRTGVVGDAYKFTRMGRGLANQKASQADVTPMDIDHSRQTAVMENWLAPEYTDIFDAQEVNFDEKAELAKTIAGAIGRREDQLIIDAMDAVTFSATPASADEGFLYDASTTKNFGLDFLRAANERMNDLEIDGSDRYMAINASALRALLNDTEVTSSDYNTVKALVNGELDSYVGFNIRIIGTRVEGGLPGGPNDRVAFAWHKPSVGLAVGIDMKTSVDWVPEKTSWLANGLYKAGAVAREPQGIIKLVYDSTL